MEATAIKPMMKANQALIQGRIDNVRSFDSQGKKVFEQRVVLPAADAYSSPASVLIQSNIRLGSVGDDIKTLVEVAGYRDSYKTRDGDTVQTARNILRAVD